MSTFLIESQDEEAGDLGALTRTVQLAALVVNAALPLEVPPVIPKEDRIPVSIQAAEEDCASLRAEAFGQVLAELMARKYTAGLSDLEALAAGRVPSPQET
jgi:hypothetical protein